MEMKEFNSVFPEIIRIVETEGTPDAQEVRNRVKQAIEYNASFGDKSRGLRVVQTYRSLASKEDLTEENLHLAAILGWLVEMLQVVYLVADDTINEAETREGKQCWVKSKHADYNVANDILSIENGMYMLLRKYFKPKKYYRNLMELFIEVAWETNTGRTLDALASTNDGKTNFDNNYTQSRWDAIAKYKTAYFTFVLPVALGMYMAGYCESKVEKMKPVLISLGQLFQAQEDYIDCYGDPKSTGESGVNIVKGKCTWMIVTALKLASTHQKKILMENYGKIEKDRVAKVKALYDEMNLPKLYEEYEKRQYQEILKEIDHLKNEIPVNVFNDILLKMYKRIK